MEQHINVTVEKLPKSMIKLTIKTKPEDLEASIEKAYQKLAKDVEVKGFRKGAAPRPMIMQELGTKLLDEAMNSLIWESTNKALVQEKLTPLTNPEFSIVDSKPEEPLTFSVQFATYPEVVIGDLTTVKIDKTEGEKAEEARQKIKEEQEAHAHEHEHDGHDHNHEEHEHEDTHVHDEEASSDESEGKEESDEEEPKEPPFSLEAYYSDILDKVFAISTIELPDAIVASELDNQVKTFTQRLEELGIKTEDYLKLQNITLDDAKENWRKDIEFSLRQDLLLTQYAKEKDIKADQEEVEKSLGEVYTPEQRASLDPSMYNYVNYAIIRQKAFLDLIHFIEKNNGITHTDSN